MRSMLLSFQVRHVCVTCYDHQGCHISIHDLLDKRRVQLRSDFLETLVCPCWTTRAIPYWSAGWCRYKPHRHAPRCAGGPPGVPDLFSSSSSDDARRSRATGSDGDASCTDSETESEEDEDWVTPQVSLNNSLIPAIHEDEDMNI